MSTPHRAMTRAEVARNARAAENERLRNEARRRFGAMSDAELAEKVRELMREKLRAAGRAGGEATRQRVEYARRVEHCTTDILAHAQVLAEHATALIKLAIGICPHEWPDDLDDPDACCGRCGLLYAEWIDSLAREAGVAA